MTIAPGDEVLAEDILALQATITTAATSSATSAATTAATAAASAASTSAAASATAANTSSGLAAASATSAAASATAAAGSFAGAVSAATAAATTAATAAAVSASAANSAAAATSATNAAASTASASTFATTASTGASTATAKAAAAVISAAAAAASATSAAASAAASGQALVATIAALRAATTTTLPATFVFVEGYYSTFDYGEGNFTYISGRTDADNGGTIIVDASGRRWFRSTNGGPYNVKWFGAHADGVTDDTGFIQNALNWCSGTGGGMVTMPTGRYLCNGTLTVFGGCGLVGLCAGRPGPDYQNFTTSTNGPVFLITNTSGAAFLTLAGALQSGTSPIGSAYAVGLAFWYPNQVTWTASTPTFYPPTVLAQKGAYMERLNDINGYTSFQIEGGRSYLIQCVSGAFSKCVFVDSCYDYVFIDNFESSASYEYYPLGAAYGSEPIDTWVRANRIGIQTARCDAFKYSNLGLYGNYVGLDFIDSPVAQPAPYRNSYGTVTGCDIDSTVIGVRATSTNTTGGGVQLMGCNIGGSQWSIQTLTGGSNNPQIVWSGGGCRSAGLGTGTTCQLNALGAGVTIRDVTNLTPFGSMAAIQPAIPTSTFVQENFFPWPVMVFFQPSNPAGVVHIKLNGVAIFSVQTMWIMYPGDTCEIDFSGITIGWTWFGL